jgi:hypothetical protein
MSKPSTLLIWEEVPDTTKLYVIPNEVADKYRSFLEQAQNKLINNDEMNPGLAFVNTALGEEVSEEGFEEHLGIFRQYEVKLDNPLVDQNITTVYHSGFYL